MEGQSLYYYLFAFLTIFAFTSSEADQTTENASIEFIKTSCNSTAYPTLCFNSLSIHAISIQTSPKILAHTALNVTLNEAKSTSTAMSEISKRKGLNQSEISAVKDCVEEVIDSVSELRISVHEMTKLKEHSADFKFMISNIQTWVSAALTDEDTCTDGFARAGMNGKTRNEVRGRIVNIAQLTSIGLALVHTYASSHI
jgi:pectinesterase inhibitor-like protein